MSEKTSVQNPSILLAGQRPDTLIWRQQSGVFRSYDTPDRIVRVGTPGMADAGAIVAVTITPDMVGQTIGVAVQVEFKTSTGRQSADQKLWQLATEKRSGVYSIVKSTNDMENLLNDISTGNHWR
jgi:hypothetical protein